MRQTPVRGQRLPRLSRPRGWGRRRRGAALPGAPSAPCPVPHGSGRFAGTTQRFVQPGLVGRSHGSSVDHIITSPPIWPIWSQCRGPRPGMTQVVHYVFLGRRKRSKPGSVPDAQQCQRQRSVEDPVYSRIPSCSSRSRKSVACPSTPERAHRLATTRPTAIHSNAEVSPPCVTESHCKGVPAEPAKRICRSCPVQFDCLEVRCPRCQGRGFRRVNGRALTAEHRHRISHRRFLSN